MKNGPIKVQRPEKPHDQHGCLKRRSTKRSRKKSSGAKIVVRNMRRVKGKESLGL
jgi:hypothetical protein